MTDIAWGPEQFPDKVFTSCSNGEIMCWNLVGGGLRFGMLVHFPHFLPAWVGMHDCLLGLIITPEASLPGGARSVNIVNSATNSPYSVATGSADGSVKLWDLRHRAPAFSLSSHGSAVRSLTFGETEIAPVHVVFGLESGMILRYDLRVSLGLTITRPGAHIHDNRCVLNISIEFSPIRHACMTWLGCLLQRMTPVLGISPPVRSIIPSKYGRSTLPVCQQSRSTLCIPPTQ